MNKNVLQELIDKERQLYKAQIEAIYQYLQYHPSVFITDAIEYEEETGRLKILSENVDWRYVRYTSPYSGNHIMGKMVGMVEYNGNIDLYFLSDDEYLVTYDLGDVLLGDYSSILEFLIDGFDFQPFPN